MDRKSAVRPYRCTRSFSRTAYRTYGLFHVQISAENTCSNGLWKGVCHRSKQGKTIGFSAPPLSMRRSLGRFPQSPRHADAAIYHGIPLYFERPTVSCCRSFAVLGGKMKSTQINFTVSAAEKQRIAKLAKSCGLKQGEYLRQRGRVAK